MCFVILQLLYLHHNTVSAGKKYLENKAISSPISKFSVEY